MRRFLFWGFLLALLGRVLMLVRPARLREAKVMAITPGDPPTASVGLRYGRGAAPVCVIVDVRGRAGGGGSVTIPGEQIFVDVPIAGILGDDYSLTATATYQIAGVFWHSVRAFTGRL